MTSQSGLLTFLVLLLATALDVVVSRSQIVEGAVSMVQMALENLSERGIVELDEERKAAMVSNLLVVLCGDKATQPVLHTDAQRETRRGA